MEQTKQTNFGAMSVLITVFFFWGFIAAGNGVFIPFCKHYFKLDQFQSQLIDFAFYGAYYIGALLLFIWANISSRDVVSSWGYKKSIVYGLLFSLLGAIAMILAVLWSDAGSGFGLFLGAFFILALGFSLQQTAANPFALTLGDPASGAHRITLGGGINSFGTAIGPIVVALALFGTPNISDTMIQSLSLNKVVILYVCVGALFLIAAGMFWFSKKVPDGVQDSTVEPARKAMFLMIAITLVLVICFLFVFNSYKLTDAGLTVDALHELESYRMKWLIAALLSVIIGLLTARIASSQNAEGWGALKYPQLILGMIAIFVYVGVEVTIQSNMGELLRRPEFGSIQSADIAPYISMYWGSLMVGRWTGAIPVYKTSAKVRNLLTFGVPLVAYIVVLLVNIIAQKNVSALYYYVFCILVMVAAFFMTQSKPVATLLLFSLLGIVAMLIGIMTSGIVSIYAFLSGGLFCSIMWPCIFSLSLAGLGKLETQGAAFLIMMILGGAIIPPLQGKLADLPAIGIHNSYWITVVCFGYLVFFAWKVKAELAKQGIDYDQQVSKSHE
ncbi:MAG TPA: MFS transporter [Saprospiraceae bacterium]|nr:MFS transporter [Saprospiraceae bacterium]